MRRALIIGIDFYPYLGHLAGAVNDALAVKRVLERNADGTVNFPSPKVLIATEPDSAVYKQQIRGAVRELFHDDADIALLYFAGHGHIDESGGFLCASDCETGDDGLSLSDTMALANRSGAKSKIIILDSCHSGAAGDHWAGNGVAEITEGTTILTASTTEQRSLELSATGSGVFTNLLVDALDGAAANLVGDITPGSIYAHIDQSLGPWAQRPVFKTNIKTFVSLRKVDAPISVHDLRAITRYFPAPDTDFRLDPSFEPERAPGETADPAIPPPDPANTAIFATLQRYARVNLIEPVGAPHMWHAAMRSRSCRLTVLGRHYWKLVREGLI